MHFTVAIAAAFSLLANASPIAINFNDVGARDCSTCSWGNGGLLSGVGVGSAVGLNPAVGVHPVVGVNPSVGINPLTVGINPANGVHPGVGVNPTVGVHSLINLSPSFGANPVVGVNPSLGVNPTIGINPTIRVNPSLGVNPLAAVDLAAIAGQSGKCYTSGCNHDAITDWANDLTAKVSAILVFLDGKNAPAVHCNDIIAVINASIKALADIDIDASGTPNSSCEAIFIIARLLVSIVLALSRYPLAVVATVLAQLDASLALLITAGNTYLGPDFGHLCGQALAHITLFVSLSLKATLKLCGQ